MQKQSIVVDFQVQRLRHLMRTMSCTASTSTSSSLVLPKEAPQHVNLPQDEAALLVALVIRLAKQTNPSFSMLPPLVQEALGDLVSEGDPTARLIYAWIDDQRDTDQGIMDTAKQSGSRRVALDAEDRVFRHRRFWRSDSARLERADQRRVERLQKLLIEVITHG